MRVLKSSYTVQWLPPRYTKCMLVITICSFYYCIGAAISPFMYGWRGGLYCAHHTHKRTAQYPGMRCTLVTQWRLSVQLILLEVFSLSYFAGKFDWDLCSGTFHIPLPTCNTCTGTFSIILISLEHNCSQYYELVFKVLNCRWPQAKCRQDLIWIDFILKVTKHIQHLCSGIRF